MQSRPREYWDKMEISYRPMYAFEEILAAFGDATGATGASDTMLAQIEAMAKRITGDEELGVPEIVEADRERVLAQYTFGPPSALGATKTHPADDAEATDFLRGVRAKEQLWRTSGFTWRRLLSRRELDLLTDEDRKQFGRNMAYYLAQSERMQQLFRSAQFVEPIAMVLAVVIVFNLALIQLASIELMFSDRNVNTTTSITVVVWMALVFVLSVFAARNKPYGVTLSQVLILSLLGPFRSNIRDYDPNEELFSARVKRLLG
jgi:hypothetical protein